MMDSDTVVSVTHSNKELMTTSLHFDLKLIYVTNKTESTVIITVGPNWFK